MPPKTSPIIGRTSSRAPFLPPSSQNISGSEVARMNAKSFSFEYGSCAYCWLPLK